MNENFERFLRVLKNYDDETLVAVNWHAHCFAYSLGTKVPTQLWETGEDFDYVDLPHGILNPDHEFFGVAEDNRTWYSAERPDINIRALAEWLAENGVDPEPFEKVRSSDYMLKDFEFIFDDELVKRGLC